MHMYLKVAYGIYAGELCKRFLFCDVFFFKQKTAYEMRISDWSSDVCSSDLRCCSWDRGPRSVRREGSPGPASPARWRCPPSGACPSNSRRYSARPPRVAGRTRRAGCDISPRHSRARRASRNNADSRSEERRVGKECARTFRSRWSAEKDKKKKK